MENEESKKINDLIDKLEGIPVDKWVPYNFYRSEGVYTILNGKMVVIRENNKPKEPFGSGTLNVASLFIFEGKYKGYAPFSNIEHSAEYKFEAIKESEETEKYSKMFNLIKRLNTELEKIRIDEGEKRYTATKRLEKEKKIGALESVLQ